MTITKLSFILVQESSDTVMIEEELEDLLVQEMRPILWFRDGLFCIIPIEILMNVLETIDFNKNSFGKDTIQIHWNQGWCMDSSRIGYALSGLNH